MRLRVALSVAVIVVAGTLVLELSGSARRGAGSDHVSTAVFSAAVPGGGTLCQPVPALPAGAAAVQLLIGTYGRPVPALATRFRTRSGVTIAEGTFRGGTHEGVVTIPLKRVHAGESAEACLHVGGAGNYVLGGEGDVPNASSEVVNGKHEPGRIGLSYLRGGRESWWQLLSVVSTRFGLGKASFMGSWTLLVLAILFVAMWVGAIRLLVRELT